MTKKSEVQAECEKGDAAPDSEKHKGKLAMYWAASCGGSPSRQNTPSYTLL